MARTDSATPDHKIDPESLAALPRTSGVYIFKGEGTLPLYIGKSVDIRARVMSQCSKTETLSRLTEFKLHDFDLDSYKILVKPIMLKTVKVEEVEL